MSDRTRVNFAIETGVDRLLAEALPMLKKHWNEVVLYQDLQIINPDYDRYREAETKGALIMTTARDIESGTMVGYHVVFLHRMLHFKNVIAALDDMHYLQPEYRRGWTAIRLIKFAENEARRRGAHLSIARTAATSQHGVLYRRLGYDLTDEVFSKRLDK